MKLRFKVKYLIGILVALVLFGIDYLLFFGERWFWPGIVVCISIAWLQFWLDYLKETKRQKEIELKFLEFVRNLVESVKSGISIPKSILHVSNEDYGALSPYIKKLSNQIEWGIPIHKALNIFANDTENGVIKRSVAIVIEAEESGGDIGDVLDSVTNSVVNVKKMKEERRSSAFSQIVQGYIVFFVFIAIMLLLQLWLFPKFGEISGSLQGGLGGFSAITSGGDKMAQKDLDRIFFSLVLIQGFFTGLMVGKFSEGTIKQGLLHSLILMTIGTLIITTAKGGI
ncbi:MAG: type II secretion system F family protein [Candidatus Woesearchaeota archaeon]